MGTRVNWKSRKKEEYISRDKILFVVICKTGILLMQKKAQ